MPLPTKNELAAAHAEAARRGATVTVVTVPAELVDPRGAEAAVALGLSGEIVGCREDAEIVVNVPTEDLGRWLGRRR